MSSPGKLPTHSVNNPSTAAEPSVRLPYMRAYHARLQAENADRQRARADALNILAALDVSEVNARVFMSAWRAQRLRDAIVVLAAAVPQETPISQIGSAA